MKHRILALILAVCLVLSLLAGCRAKNGSPDAVTLPLGTADQNETPTKETPADPETEPTEPETEPTEPETEPEELPTQPDYYDRLLNYFYLLLQKGGYEVGAYPGSVGISEAARALGDDVMEEIGYAVTDLSGDGIPELVIGSIPKDGLGGKEIYAIYCWQDGTVWNTVEGWARNAWFALPGNRYLYIGSGGAAYTTIAVYTLGEDGSAMIPVEYYFTEPNEDNSGLNIYYNTTGSNEADESSLTGIDAEALWDWEEMHYAETISLDLTPFSAYQLTEVQEPELNGDDSAVSVKWGSEIEDWSFDYDSIYISYDTEVLFSVQNPVTDFTLLDLTLDTCDEEGNMTFVAHEITAWDTLTADRPVLVGLSFYGLVPAYGISYVDETGAKHTCAVDISGMDGSVYLWEIEIAE